MKVSEAIKNKTRFVITNSSKILAISNGDSEGCHFGKNNAIPIKDILNMEVVKIEQAKDLLTVCHTDYDFIRV